MKFQRKNYNDSQYITFEGLYKNSSTPHQRKLHAVIFSAFMAVLFSLLSFSSLIQPISTLASAENPEDDAKTKIQEESKKYVEGEEDPDFFTFMNLYSEQDNPDSGSFGYILQRVFTVRYLNNTQLGVAASGMSNPGNNCSVDDPRAGTALYHNCDVPNIMTELLQDVVAYTTSTGIVGGETSSATLDYPIFGMPSNLPADGAAVDPTDRAYKYTGLELYGYNLHYTNYNGEWDHIKVLTSARSLSNFGFMDDMKLGVSSVFNGVAGGLQKGTSNFVNSMSQGDIFGAIGGMYSGFFGGGTANVINTVLDTSDLNVFNTYAWYRVGYGPTLYNARELSSTELAASAKSQLTSILLGATAQANQIPQDLQEVQAGPEDPKENISKCIYKDSQNKESSYGNTLTAPGPTEESCTIAAKNAYNARQASANPPSNDKPYSVWTVDGTQKKQTLADWKTANQKYFTAAEKYGINCTIDTAEATRKDALAQFKACWPNAWDTAVTNYQDQAQQDAIENPDLEAIVKNVLSPEYLQDLFANSSEANFNAPWNRFVCTDANGDDLKDDNGELIKLYDDEGDVNEACNIIRQPIQNGYFGNGYTGTQPGIDTRNSFVETDIISAIFPSKNFFNSLANFGLYLSGFFTRISNTILNLTFSPLLEGLGIHDKVVALIKGFRDSIFFPLAVLVIGVSSIMALYSAGKNKDYGRQARSLILVVLTFISGIVIMYRPETTIKLMDEVPAQIQSAVMGSVFSAGNYTDDQLCTSTGTVSAESSTDLKGNSVRYTASEGTRALMCENWRTFALNPWVYGQFGTTYDHLYAADTDHDYTMNNTNSALVGSASVNMGANTIEQNWALYQLESMFSGTASNPDYAADNGITNPNMYRLVDLQAGPNNGEGTDSRYYSLWSGESSGGRVMVAYSSAVVAFVGMITVIIYAISLIQIQFVMLMMLMFLPFMFLIGLHQTQGRTKLKGYLGSLVGLILQRIILALALALLFRIVSSMGTVGGNYLISALFALATCIFFLKIRKPLLSKMFEFISTGFGRPVGEQFMSDPKAWSDANIVKTGSPRGYIANKREQLKYGGQSIIGGGIAGYINGGMGEAIHDARESSGVAMRSLLRRQQMRGFGIGQTATTSFKAGAKDAQSKIYSRESAQSLRENIHKNSDEYKDYEKQLELYEKIKEKTPDGEDTLHPDTGEIIEKPQEPEKKELPDDLLTTKRISKMDTKREKAEKLLDKDFKDNIGSKKARIRIQEDINELDNDNNNYLNDVMENKQFNELSNNDTNDTSSRRIDHNRNKAMQAHKKQEQIEKMEDKLLKNNNKEYHKSMRSDEMMKQQQDLSDIAKKLSSQFNIDANDADEERKVNE